MDAELLNKIDQKLNAQEEKLEAIYVSAEKTRKYFFWTMVITLVLFIVPLIGLVFAIPKFLSTYSEALNF